MCGFDGAPESRLEIVTAHAALGALSLPGVTLFVFRHDGQEFAVRPCRRAGRLTADYTPFSWTFGARVGEQTIQGEITASPRT